MRQVRRLEIATSRAVDEAFAGEYQSAFRGRGMEFDEVREYAPGDDVRTIDWNVTARTGRPFVKRYVEERELTVILAVDLSASGRFGSVEKSKHRTAAELCGVLAFAAARKNDRAGLLAFTDHIETFVPARKGRTHVLRILREVLNIQPRGAATNIPGALDHLAHVLKKRAVIFLISDFLDEGYTTNLRLLARRHDVIALRITDPRERELPSAGLIDLLDPETNRVVIVDAGSRRVRAAWRRAAERRDERFRTEMARLGVDHATVETGRSYLPALLALFRKREKRR